MAKKLKPNDTFSKLITKKPARLAAGTMQNLLGTIGFEDSDDPILPGLEGFADAIKESTAAIQRGDLGHLEALMYAQVETLNTMFHTSLNRAHGAAHLPQVQHYSDCALKAQNQCRRTVLAIAELNQPKNTTVIKQQNNAVNQQVNNSENKSQPENEIYEGNHVEKVDGREPKTSVGVDTSLETVDFNNGTKDRGGEKAVIEKQYKDG